MRSRLIDNTNKPLETPEGKILSSVVITFTLVDENGRIADVFDMATKERIAGKASVMTDINGCFQLHLFPNDYGDIASKYLVHVNSPYIKDFYCVVPAGEDPLSLYDLKYLNGTPISPDLLQTVKTYIDGNLSPINSELEELNEKTTYNTDFINDIKNIISDYNEIKERLFLVEELIDEMAITDLLNSIDSRLLTLVNRFSKQTVIFHDGQSTAGNGNSFAVGNYKNLKVGIKQNTTNSSVEFHGVDEVGNDILINGYDIDYNSAKTITGNNVMYDIDVTGLTSFYVKTNAANLLIKGIATV